MRSFLNLLLIFCLVTVSQAAGISPRDVVVQLYQAHQSKHDPLDETQLLSRYFDSALLKLYLKDKREAKGEVGRLDGDPLYNAQEIEIKNFSISGPTTSSGDTRIVVSFTNLGKPTRVIYILRKTSDAWRISDIRYDDGSSLKQILER